MCRWGRGRQGWQGGVVGVGGRGQREVVGLGGRGPEGGRGLTD